MIGRIRLAFGLAVFLLSALLLLPIAHADVPAVCDPLKSNWDKAIAAKDRPAAIVARQRIKTFEAACPKLWASVRDRALPAQVTKPGTAVPRPPKPKVRSGGAAPILRNERSFLQENEALCAEGDNLGCLRLASAYYDGRSDEVVKDRTKARAVYEYACARGLGEPCVRLAYMTEDGDGGPKDLTRAALLFEQACEHGYSPGCDAAGGMYQYGSVPKDLARARANFEKGCSDGSANSCSGLSSMVKRGDGGTADPVRAAQLRKRACELGDKYACEN